jgi:hypothetical protein
MNRMSDLLEVVDLSMAQLRQDLLSGPDGALNKVLDAIEKDFLRLRGQEYNENLTGTIVKALLPALGETEAFLGKYTAFVEGNLAKITHVLSEYKGDMQHVFLSQSEYSPFIASFASPSRGACRPHREVGIGLGRA